MSDQTEHTLIHVICDECGEVDVLAIVEHPRESAQTEIVSESQHTVAGRHADQTGHHVEVGVTEGTPEEIRTQAQSMADSIDGAEPEDFTPEMVPDGGVDADAQLLGYVIGPDDDAVTVCADCGEPDGDNVKIKESPAYGDQVPYPECWVCGEVMRPETVATDGGRTVATNRTTRDASIDDEPRWRFEWKNFKNNRRFPL